MFKGLPFRRQPHLQQVCICFRFVLPQKNELQTSERTWLHLQKPGKAMDVIARREATRQSVLPAVSESEKQYFGQMRRALRICPGSSQFAGHSCRDADCHTSWLQSPPCRRPKVRHAQLRPKARAGQRSLGTPLPAKGNPLRGPHALVRNDMQKTDGLQRLQGTGSQ